MFKVESERGSFGGELRGRFHLPFSIDGGPATSASLAFPIGAALDGAGNLFIADFLNEHIRRVQTPALAIQELIAEVVALNLKQGIENSLDAKLDVTVQALDDMNQNNDVAAVNSLQAFINYVEAQRSVSITDADADALIAQVQQVIAVLGG